MYFAAISRSNIKYPQSSGINRQNDGGETPRLGMVYCLANSAKSNQARILKYTRVRGWTVCVREVIVSNTI